ncbi:DUF2141 domain-containing protein [Tenacibaculum sp. M341]|uniref:DUF2141 domain-containing protein n=1 Tax=Tenacibaculum sp. M341 TaxID=2530339 RepID=UPI0010430D21|nr:DUF2141 domain-containing protein [Tenacibaculum sp. M341]TCI92629.1 DUF2141 domain-containing protein [Tenacibaculum sp. M341]
MVRIFQILAILILTTISSFAQNNHTLTIEFSGMDTDTGNVFVGIHNKEADFLKKRFKEAVVVVKNNKATAVFENLPEGEYAVSAFHDENDNKKMDTKIFGIPKEPIGVSNNAKGFMGPPKYKDAKFTLDKDLTLKIEMD